MKCFMASMLIVAIFRSAVLATGPDALESAKLIVGTWDGDGAIHVFGRDGTWRAKRKFKPDAKETAGRWRIRGDTLTLKYSGDHGLITIKYTIVFVSPQEFVTEQNFDKQRWDRLH